MPEDVPDFFLTKPKELEDIEKLPRDILESMTPVEMEEKIKDTANALAQIYSKKTAKGSFDQCVFYVSGALRETGAAISGKLGGKMIGISQNQAETACREFFPDSTEPNQVEY